LFRVICLQSFNRMVKLLIKTKTMFVARINPMVHSLKKLTLYMYLFMYMYSMPIRARLMKMLISLFYRFLKTNKASHQLNQDYTKVNYEIHL